MIQRHRSRINPRSRDIIQISQRFNEIRAGADAVRFTDAQQPYADRLQKAIDDALKNAERRRDEQ